MSVCVCGGGGGGGVEVQASSKIQMENWCWNDSEMMYTQINIHSYPQKSLPTPASSVPVIVFAPFLQ